MTTPAPWRVDRNTYNTLVTTRGATVAIVMTNNNGDAELICAAPFLLTALESLVEAVVLDLHPESLRAALSTAREAIAMAGDGK